MVARLLWSCWYERLPPSAFPEEAWEALLSCAVHRLACNTGATFLEHHFDEFV